MTLLADIPDPRVNLNPRMGSQTDFGSIDAKVRCAHPERLEQLLVSHHFGIDVSKFGVVGERLSLPEFTQVLVDGDKHILQKMNVGIGTVHYRGLRLLSIYSRKWFKDSDINSLTVLLGHDSERDPSL